MENIVKRLLDNIHPKDINKILEPHISEIIKDEEKKRIKIFVNKKYAMNDLMKSDNLADLVKGVYKTFGEDYSTTLKLKTDGTHDREMLVPHTIHF